MENKDIWIFAEEENGQLSQTVLELLAKAQDLKKLFGGNIIAVMAGKTNRDVTDKLAQYGADGIIAAENDNLENYSPRPYAKALSQLAEKYRPSIFLLGATPMGRELAPRVMCALHTGLTADAIDLGMDEEGDFVQTTPGFGGNILAHICIKKSRPQMVTVRPGVFEPLEPKMNVSIPVTVEKLQVEADEDYEVLETIQQTQPGKPLKDASVVVACGRGLKSLEDLEMVKQFADLIGANTACSRPLADCGWMEHSMQIGQSGCTVKADYIINIGISGSTQYLAGMEKSKCIVSINSNKDAAIFGVSHYGAVEDYRKFLPAVIKKIQAMQA